MDLLLKEFYSISLSLQIKKNVLEKDLLLLIQKNFF